MGLQTALTIGKESLLVTQAALQTVAHNIANAGVEGYSRQEVVLVNNPPVTGFIGTGVRLETVRQVVDRFLNAQIARFKSEDGSLSAQASGVLATEAFLNESGTEGGIAGAINKFFAAAEDLGTTPEGAAERNGLVNAAGILAEKFNRLGKAVEDLQIGADRNITRAIDEVNQFAERIARLNSDILVGEASGDTENDLRDERRRILEDLSERVDVNVIEETNGSLLIFVGRSAALVSQRIFNKLVGEQNPNNVVGNTPPVALQRVLFEDRGNVRVDISSRITNGKIGGLLEFRDTTLKNLLDDINTIAATIVNEVNIIHKQGFGLDGSTNLDFFQPLKVSLKGGSSNSKDVATGNPNVQSVLSNSKIFDATALTMADYKLEFTSSTTFTITDTDTNQKLNATQVSIDGGPLGTDPAVTTFNFTGGSVTAEFEGIRIVVQKFSGDPQTGDSFTVSVRTGAAKKFAFNNLLAADISKIATAGVPGSPGDNANALKLANLRGDVVAGRNTATISDFMNGIISNFGSLSRNITDRQEVTSQVKDALNTNREEVSGVSIDEEMVSIILFQQNFAASAKVISTITDLLQQVIDIIR